MQPPIPPGIILQNRYRLTKSLGQGGFGRTYLAQDRDRFNEICVIKEYLVPTQAGEYVLNKTKELFQREAEVLYKIDHPQIPKFRATFEQGKRLFFVQDYVEGKTYRVLLDERLEEDTTFSEAEAVKFLQEMLPVLEHIHSKGIIHRDISPENIILRESDRLPVLIDFGAVKEGVANLQASEEAPQGTTMGKIGYSPDEQLRTGQVYPNSDIYALAVTTVVLMTGKKPQELLDQSTMTWRWHQWLPTLSLHFSNLLNRMMSARPNNRYQSATEVLQALRSLHGLVGTSENQTIFKQQIKTQTTPTPSSIKTRRPTVTRQPTRNPIWNNPWALATIVGGVVLFISIGPVVLLGSMFNTNRVKISRKAAIAPTTALSPDAIAPTASPISDIVPTPTLTPTPNSPQVTQSDRVTLLRGERTSKQGNLKVNQLINYIIFVEEGQQLKASLSGGKAAMTILAPNRELLNFQAKQVQRWEGKMPLRGEYYIQLSLPEGVKESNYQLDLNLPNQ
jgi:serine/threonine-protein kinase